MALVRFTEKEKALKFWEWNTLHEGGHAKCKNTLKLEIAPHVKDIIWENAHLVDNS
jgi:hypothetical protein